MATENKMAAIEGALGENMRRCRSHRDFYRCDTRRRELLERALALPLTSDAEAAPRFVLL